MPKVLRFRQSERWLHWGLAVPFLVCLASAATLIVFYNFSPGRPHRDVVSWIHKAGGLSLVVLPLLAVARRPGDLRLHFHNVRQAWGWTLKDLKWLALLGAAALTKRVRLPEQGKFNAGEKLNFMAVMASYPLFIMTGALIWLTGANLLAWIAHVLCALVVAPLVLGHVYMALINPGTRKGMSGMITGYVDREWAREHYREWYRETYGDAEVADPKSVPIRAHFGSETHQFGAARVPEPPRAGAAGPG